VTFSIALQSQLIHTIYMTETAKKKSITIDELATMTQRGFADMGKSIAEVRDITMATREDVAKLDERLKRIGEIVILDHYPRMRVLEKALGI
jgi:hypothetical protein